MSGGKIIDLDARRQDREALASEIKKLRRERLELGQELQQWKIKYQAIMNRYIQARPSIWPLIRALATRVVASICIGYLMYLIASALYALPERMGDFNWEMFYEFKPVLASALAAIIMLGNIFMVGWPDVRR